MQASCDCGYTVNATSDDSYAVFTELLETDFLHLQEDAFDWDKRNATGWSYQVYNMTAQDARGPYGKTVESRNVVLNPMKSIWDWAGPTVHGGDGGMQVWVRSDVQNGEIPGGEVTSLGADMVYGSYRVGVKWTATPGTCGAFFWFRNNSQEIDLEYLSWEQAPNATWKSTFHPINLVNQSPESAAAGYNAAGTPDFLVFPLLFDPSTSFHEYRFDWTSERVSFYADGVWIHDMMNSVPNEPGQLFLNHWSNGDPGWSGGPPKQDALLTVSYVKAYFNSSDGGKNQAYADRCSSKYTGDAMLQNTCQIPDQKTPPDQSGPDANETSKTHFFTNTQPIANSSGNGSHKNDGPRILDNSLWLLGEMTTLSLVTCMVVAATEVLAL